MTVFTLEEIRISGVFTPNKILDTDSSLTPEIFKNAGYTIAELYKENANGIYDLTQLMKVFTLIEIKGTREELITNGSGYRGNQSVTRSGNSCQQWHSQSPHSHSNTPSNKPNAGLEGNQCRNPDNSSTIWCYTTDPLTRWEYCDPIYLFKIGRAHV